MLLLPITEHPVFASIRYLTGSSSWKNRYNAVSACSYVPIEDVMEYFHERVYKLYMTENCIMFISCRYFHIVFLCLMGVGLGGCATTTNVQLAQANMNVPVKILVIQSPITIDSGRLQTVLAPDIKPELSVSEEPISQGVKHAQEHALAAMESALTKQSKLIVVTPPAEEIQFVDKIRHHDFASAISQDEADRIQTTTGADALLRFGITDYGLTPQSWRNGYIAFEVTTTLALAAVIAYSSSVAAKTAAGIYLVQETIEETATAYAGFWALDLVCRPVRMEAELIRLNPVTTLWKTSDTGLSDVSLSRLTRKVGSDERDRQLDQSTDYAVKDVTSDLTNALKNTNPEHSQLEIQ
jgi:hypothetical protein